MPGWTPAGGDAPAGQSALWTDADLVDLLGLYRYPMGDEPRVVRDRQRLGDWCLANQRLLLNMGGPIVEGVFSCLRCGRSHVSAASYGYDDRPIVPAEHEEVPRAWAGWGTGRGPKTPHYCGKPYFRPRGPHHPDGPLAGVERTTRMVDVPASAPPAATSGRVGDGERRRDDEPMAGQGNLL